MTRKLCVEDIWLRKITAKFHSIVVGDNLSRPVPATEKTDNFQLYHVVVVGNMNCYVSHRISTCVPDLGSFLMKHAPHQNYAGLCCVCEFIALSD